MYEKEREDERIHKFVMGLDESMLDMLSRRS